MSFRVVIDSCGDLTDEMKKSGNFVSAPLTLQVDEYIVQDDEEHFNQAEFLKKVAECPNCPKSSCPSPEIYRDAYDCDADHVYAVTLSEKLSGSYNSAVLGKNLYLEDHPDAKVYVFNSCSASVGETLIGLKIQELEEKGLSEGHQLCSFCRLSYSRYPDYGRTGIASHSRLRRSHNAHPDRQPIQSFPANGHILFLPRFPYYILSWQVLAITSSCCSLVRSINLTAYPDTRIVKFAYSSFSGCSIASISFSFPNTFTFR